MVRIGSSFISMIKLGYSFSPPTLENKKKNEKVRLYKCIKYCLFPYTTNLLLTLSC